MLILLNKPYGMLTQFRRDGDRPTLADVIDRPEVRVAGRLDADSEGLVLLTDDGQLNAALTNPRSKTWKTYWVQVEGLPTDEQLAQLTQGIQLNDGLTLPARVQCMEAPSLWPRNPPIRERKSVPDSWLSLQIREGRNRQIRRMTAAVGLPTLRLVRTAIGPYQLDRLQPNEWRIEEGKTITP